jgi:hypothetical protein
MKNLNIKNFKYKTNNLINYFFLFESGSYNSFNFILVLSVSIQIFDLLDDISIYLISINSSKCSFIIAVFPLIKIKLNIK